MQHHVKNLKAVEKYLDEVADRAAQGEVLDLKDMRREVSMRIFMLNLYKLCPGHDEKWYFEAGAKFAAQEGTPQ